MTFSTETIIALGIGGLLAIAIPAAAIIIYKVKNKETWLPAVFIGAGTFFVFALILEQLLHAVMLPVIGDSVAGYVIYGALAAGIFEETGRFVAYKTLMRKHYTTKNSIMMGLGHGGFEAMILIGTMMLSYLVLAITVNSVGMDEVLNSVGNDEALIEAAKTQIEAISGFGFINVGLTIFERLIAMTVHVCFSVWVYKAVSVKGKLWLFPAAALAHAVIDIAAALYQKGVWDILPVYIYMAVGTAIVVVITVIMAKKLPDKSK